MMKPKYSILDHRVIGWYYPFMMKGLKPASSPLLDKIRLIKAVGFDGVGTSWWDLIAFYQERGDLAQVKAFSEELKLPLTGFGFLADGWAFGSGQAQRDAVVLAKYSLDLAHAAGCDTGYLVGPHGPGDLKQAAPIFRELCQHAGSLGMKLALEFMGMSPSLNSVNT